MLQFLLEIFSNNWKSTIIASFFIISIPGAYFLGIEKGKTIEQDKSTYAALKAWEKSNAIQNDIQRLSPVDLCIELGGLRSNCEEQLRGLEATAKSE